MKGIKWLWKYLKNYKWNFAIVIILSLTFTMLAMINPYLIGVVFDKVIYGGNKELLVGIICTLILVTIGKSVVRYIYLLILESTSQKTIYAIREDIYTKIQELDFEFFDNNKTGDIMSKLTGDIEAIRHFVAWVVHNIFLNILTFVVALILMMNINWKLTCSMLVVVPFVAYFSNKLASSVRPTFMAIREQFSRLNSVVQENISGNRVVKAFTKEDYEIEKFDKENQAFKDKNIASAKVWGKYLPVLDSLAISMSIIMLFVGGYMCIKEQMTVAELVTINGYIWAINGPLRMAGWLINDSQRFLASYKKVMTILEEEPKIKNDEAASRKDIKGTITFNHVSFKYANEPIIEDISFTAHSGQTIAILGPTGSGKTTLVNLICRFYDCDDGIVMIDGVNVKDMNVKELRKNIAIAMQDIFLFSDTIEGNIAYGNPKASMGDVQWAADIAGVQEFIHKFPEGYNTIIGERGVGLSGGQRQRIALARALLKNPSILILDDTTSSVDMETEFKIHSNLKEMNKNRTTFIIAHRISSVKDADLILVLDEGRVVERGTHKELLNTKGHYYDVFLNQLGDFDNEDVKEVV